jgi:hypothetical protein
MRRAVADLPLRAYSIHATYTCIGCGLSDRRSVADSCCEDCHAITSGSDHGPCPACGKDSLVDACPTCGAVRVPVVGVVR